MTRNTYPYFLIPEHIPEITCDGRRVSDAPCGAIPRTVHLTKILGPHHKKIVELMLCEPGQAFPLSVVEEVMSGYCLMPQLVIER